MPRLGQITDEMEIIRWLKAEGEPVQRGEPLLEVLTDKATVEVESWANGVLRRTFFKAGEKVASGTVIAVITALGELVPIIGAIIAGVVATAIALTVSLKLAAAALIYFVVLQQVESNVLVPKIMQRQVGLSPVAVIVALMVGAEIHGIIGAILAIPTTVILKVVFEELTERRISSQQTADRGQ